MRQLLIESLVLSLTGGALGLLLSFWIVRLLLLVARDMAFIQPRADLRMLGFTVLVSVLTGILFGFAPAWQVSALDFLAGALWRLSPRGHWPHHAIGADPMDFLVYRGHGLQRRAD
jgi:hypothetical protein